MPDPRRRHRPSLHLERLEDRQAPSATPLSQSFDTTSAGQLPSGWAQWSSSGQPVFTVSNQMSASPAQSLAATTTQNWVTAQAWNVTPEPADVEVSADVFVNNAMPVALVARGSGLNTATPTYYGVQIMHGMQATLYRMQNGVFTFLGWAGPAQAFNPEWVRVTFNLSGTNLRAQFFRLDTAQYLAANGLWQSTPTWAITASDSALAGGGLEGFARRPSLAGTIYLDDFRVFSSAGDTQPPTVSIPAPSAPSPLTGVVPIHAYASDNIGIAHVDFYVDGTLRASDTQIPFTWNFDTTSVASGTHQVTARAYDIAGNSSTASVSVTTSDPSALPTPSIPQHYPWIRVAQLAYAAGQLDPFGQQLLTNSVDLTITDYAGLMNQISTDAPNTDQLLYTNVSTLYGSLLADWLNYARANGYNPENAFYHVTQATPYSGTSPSSLPVNWFWSVYRTGSAPADLTVTARGTTPGQYTSLGGSAGDALYVGYPDPFRQVQVNLVLPASAGWTEQLEYPTAVDANGNPTQWARISLLGDDTHGLHGPSGWIWFNPPANWVPASINGSARMYYVRFRTVIPGTPPVARSILGADYTGANGGNSGVIPAFDTSADLNHDGYLDDAEYAHRKPGMNARFLYQSRALYANYGEMRFATDPSNPVFRTWAVDYVPGLMAGQPYSIGVLIDNSLGTPLLVGNALRESTAAYAQDYASLMANVAKAIAPRVLVTNTNNDAIIANSTGAFEEFAFAALANTWQKFESLAASVSQQLALRAPSPYLILDSMPTSGSPADPRTQLATLAYYYLLGDPTSTFITFFGGAAPGTSWTQHWVQAAAYNVGQPLGSWSLLATGADPESPDKTYHVYQRAYSNALVLYKPLSLNSYTGVAGTLDNTTATTLSLSGTYRPLLADGTLGAPITQISLRNGEGAILIKV